MRRLSALSLLIPLAAAAISLLSSSAAFAASYQRTDGTIVDPILDIYGNVANYTGPDLVPGVDFESVLAEGRQLNGLNLAELDLSGATLGLGFDGFTNLHRASFFQTQGSIVFLNGIDATYARFDSAVLTGMVFVYLTSDFTINDLSGASFRGANLSSALGYVNLSGSLGSPVVNFSGTDFSDANLSNNRFYSADYIGSPLYNANTDFTGATTDGGQPFDPVAAGWTLVPEPGTALLLGLGLTALAVRRGE